MGAASFLRKLIGGGSASVDRRTENLRRPVQCAARRERRIREHRARARRARRLPARSTIAAASEFFDDAGAPLFALA